MRLIFRSPMTIRKAKDDAGSALAMVVAVFGITILLASLAASSAVNGLGFTSATRAGIQSQSSAEAGISYALADMTKNYCRTPSYNSDRTSISLGAAAADVHFKVKVASSANADGPWIDRCPMPPDDKFVRFISTGTPEANGLQSRGDIRTVEAIYNWTPGGLPTDIRPSGPAIYSYKGGLFTGSSQVLNPDPANADNAVIGIKTGDAGCSFVAEGQSAIFRTDIVVENGSWNSEGSCQVFGNVWANGDIVTKQSSRIQGSVWGTSLDMSFSSTITKDAWIGGPVSMINSTTIVGHLTAASRTGNVPGSETIDPSLNGVRPTFPSGIDAVPNWTNYNYNPDQWPGWSYKAMAAPCNYSTMQGAVDLLAVTNPDRGVVLDLRLCGPGVISWSTEAIKLKTDLVVIAPNKFVIAGSNQMIADPAGVPRKFWLIQEDANMTDAEPTCLPGNYISLGESFVVHGSVSTMVYTPCTITLGQSATWRGQFYAGGVNIGQSATMSYAPGGLPGRDLADGSYTADGGGGFPSKLGTRVSIRDLDAGH